MADYISREAAIKIVNTANYNKHDMLFALKTIPATIIPAADVLPRDEAIKMWAELAAMHCSDATSQQFEEAYLKGVEDGMTRRDVRPVVRGKWSRVYDDFMKSNYDTCSCCGKEYFGANGFNFCPNCGAMMEES